MDQTTNFQLAKNAYNSHFSALVYLFLTISSSLIFYSRVSTCSKKMVEQSYTIITEHSRKAPLSPPVTDTSDTCSVGTISRYDDDEEEPDTDHLDDNTAVERLIKHNSLEEYNPDTTTHYAPYNPNNYNPWYYDSSGAGGSGSGAGGSGTSGY